MLSKKYIKYNHEKLRRDIYALKSMYEFVRVSSIGKSVWKNDIFNVNVGEKGGRRIHINATHHSLEWITSALLIQFLFDFCHAAKHSEKLFGYDARSIYDNVNMSFVPMVNPDGVKMVSEGIPFGNSTSEFIRSNWQSNANGVDLNHNYDAGFYTYKKIAQKEGYDKPMHTRYPGNSPLDQPETRALAQFVTNNNFYISLAFHSQGEEIYYEYKDMELPLSEQMAGRLGEVSGYSVCKTGGLASYSGFKDFVISKLKRYGFTVEVGRGKNPLHISQLDTIYEQNARIILEAASISKSI